MRWTLTAGIVLAVEIALTAMDATLDLRGIDEAVTLGQSRSDRDRSRFHAPYRIVVDRAPVDYFEIVTPFRRIVLAAETRARGADRSFGQRQALEILAAAPPTVAVAVELTFHPMHTFVGVPDYDVVLLDGISGRRLPRETGRIPRHGPRIEGAAPVPSADTVILPGTKAPMVGGTIVARFDALALGRSAVYDIAIDDAGKELARARVDLSRLR
jgi:hypothetical protein